MIKRLILAGLAAMTVCLTACQNAAGAESSPAVSEPETETEIKIVSEGETDAKKETEQETEEAAGEGREEIRIDGAEDSTAADGMEEYASLSFFCGDAEWKLEFLAQEDMVESGELMLDDRCHFVIRAVSGEQNFVLFDETVQLGTPQGDVFTDVENQLHIVIQDARTAQYRIIDYRYDEGENVFFGEVLADYGGVNYWGEVR